MIFIPFPEASRNRTIYINPETVSSFYERQDGHTMITFVTGVEVSVKKTAEQVDALLSQEYQ